MVRAVTRGPEPQPLLSSLGLAGLMAVAGVAHFVLTEEYEQIVPRVLPRGWARPLVQATGVAEIAVAVLLAVPRSRRRAALAAAVLLVAVFPANVQMALDGGLPGERFPWGSPVVAWLRVPLQVPLVLWALAVARNRPAAAQR